jgi:uncharacterized protein (DUF1810 family)
MWFVFPQITGLGSSRFSRFFALSSLEEARAYLDHGVLGARLVESARAVLTIEGRSAEQVFGPTDALKLRSSMTLFARAAPEEAVYFEVLRRYFAGVVDPATDERI